ncbi:hypothetical protein SORBI_3005G221250 [Sorghum bicolor]|uniref:Uncharacterized protein n=1 Tax=Sorghum bicolor TaxID=4558 RepID=A0A1Z5RJX7_SORBI|nr:hypothetical protein SORBI_3005G221250 [Sorghum bicolor]
MEYIYDRVVDRYDNAREPRRSTRSMEFEQANNGVKLPCFRSAAAVVPRRSGLRHLIHVNFAL